MNRYVIIYERQRGVVRRATGFFGIGPDERDVTWMVSEAKFGIPVFIMSVPVFRIFLQHAPHLDMASFWTFWSMSDQ